MGLEGYGASPRATGGRDLKASSNRRWPAQGLRSGLFDSRNPQPLGNVPSLEAEASPEGGRQQPASFPDREGWALAWGQARVGAWDLGRAA